MSRLCCREWSEADLKFFHETFVPFMDAVYGAPPLTRRDLVFGVLFTCALLAGCAWFFPL